MELGKKFIIVVENPLFDIVFRQIKKYSNRYFYTLHDKGSEKPHYHIYVELYYLTSRKTLSNLLYVNKKSVIVSK